MRIPFVLTITFDLICELNKPRNTSSPRLKRWSRARFGLSTLTSLFQSDNRVSPPGEGERRYALRLWQFDGGTSLRRQSGHLRQSMDPKNPGPQSAHLRRPAVAKLQAASVPVAYAAAPWDQGRFNQWAHWARAQGPRIFFEGPPTGCGEII